MGKEEEEEEGRLVESELEAHIREHKDSLSAINDALASDPNNLQLLSVQQELISGIKHAEEGLVHLKRARFLNQPHLALDADLSPQPQPHLALDAALSPQPQPHVALDASLSDHQHPQPQPHVALDAALSLSDHQHPQPQPIDVDHVVDPTLENTYRVGSKCRFRHTDGRWYNAQILHLEDSSSALVSFLTPTSHNMMMCNFFLQQRCRFGANCRFSHGSHLPFSSLKKYIPPCWGQSYVGSTIFAVSETRPGIWREAELQSWDDTMNQGTVVFRDSRNSEKLGPEAMALSQYAQRSDDYEQETDSSSYEQSGSSDDEDGGLPQGLGFVDTAASQRGIQTDTAIFAKWENHTRGIASKMMANMGYRQGMGLGLSGQGMVDPIPVKVLPPKQSLDHALQSSNIEKSSEKKKRSRGGKRKRDKKYAEAARAAKQEEERPDVFSLINNHLTAHAEAINEQVSAKKHKGRDEKKEDRRSLVAYEDEVKEMRTRVQRLEEMVNRNRKEKAVYDAAMRKLEEARKSLAEAQAKHTSASHAVVSKEKEKRWLKF